MENTIKKVGPSISLLPFVVILAFASTRGRHHLATQVDDAVLTVSLNNDDTLCKFISITATTKPQVSECVELCFDSSNALGPATQHDLSIYFGDAASQVTSKCRRRPGLSADSTHMSPAAACLFRPSVPLGKQERGS